MSKKKKEPIKVQDILNKVKVSLDPKNRVNKVRFKNENVKRSSEIFTLIVGITIIGIAVVKIILPIGENYPFNFTQMEKIKQKIVSSEMKKEEIKTKISESIKYEEVVNAEEENLNTLYDYLPSQVDPLSFMVYIEQIAQKNGIEIDSLVLPENRRSSVVTNDVDITKQTNSTTTDGTVDNGTTLGQTLSNTPTATPAAVDPNASPTTNADGTTGEVKKEEEKVDNSYVIDIKIVGMYTKLTAFFKDLEKTREIIEISDVKIKEYQPTKLGEDGNPLPEEQQVKTKVDINNFDMNKIKTEITFKVKLYDKKTFSTMVEENNNATTEQVVNSTTEENQVSTDDVTTNEVEQGNVTGDATNTGGNQ